MKKLNFLLTIASFNVLLVTIERFSPTTKITLQPYSFLHLHEVFQITVLILITVLVPFLILKELTQNFGLLKTKRGLILGSTFLLGVYFYATGNGAHEIASYLFNAFCPIYNFTTSACRSMFFNDYYFGNILYFIGAYLMYIPLILFEIQKPNTTFTKKDLTITTINSLVYSFAIFAYAAFDRVLVGLAYTLITTATIDYFLITSKKKFVQIPFTYYNGLAYTLATIASLIIRLR